MKYLLVTPKGYQFVYYVRGCAEIFQQIFGGEIHSIEHSIVNIN